MMHRPLSTTLALALSLMAGCSALVAPDTRRLDDDGGSGANGDSGFVPGTDSGLGCGAGQIDCGGVCVLPSSDRQHCGSCANSCGPTEACISGVCTGGGGVVLGDPNDCGAAHATCASLQLCLSGACVCRMPYTDVGGTCIDLATDPNNCGIPGHTCANLCANGICRPANCPPGTTSCSGACVDLRRDPGNCGDCGRTCSGTQICAGDCRDVTVPADCTRCPCDACGGGARCCSYPGLSTPVCIDGVDFCPPV